MFFLICILVVEFLLLVVVLIGLLYSVYLLYGAVSFAPYVKTDRVTRRTMLDMAGELKGKCVLELGSGNGSLCLEAAERGATAVGIELNPVLVVFSRLRSRHAGLSKRTLFQHSNFWRASLPKETDVVLLYGLPERMARVQHLLETQLKPGALIISNAFLFSGMKPVRQEGRVWVYRLG